MFLLNVFVMLLAIFADDDFIIIMLWLWIIYWLEAAHAVYCGFVSRGNDGLYLVIVVILMLLLSDPSFITTLLY